MPKYKRPEPKPADPYRSDALPTDRPAAIYYRQSSDAQIGNINTTLQTVDMFEHLLRQGWAKDSIAMIDMDAGVSGTTKITDRKGMSRLMELIESEQISLVAAQDVDRFFRDITHIQTNIFIDACRRNSVRIMTPRMIYDFTHPTMGAYHMKMFREEAQQAADYLEYHIKGRLARSREYLVDQGLWSGRSVAYGYMVDLRKKLPDGSRNPTYKKYVPFRPCADVLVAYFELFKRFNRNLLQTWKHIEQYGPFTPENVIELVPDGFKINLILKHRSIHNGRLMHSYSGLTTTFSNVVFLGHWMKKGVILHFHNHEPLIGEDLFMYAFNAVSATDFFGEPNPHYMPQRPFIRHDRAKRGCEPPVYAGLVFSDEVKGAPHRRMHSAYNHIYDNYAYVLSNLRSEMVFRVKADWIDDAIDKMLLERLQSTTIDDAAWQAAVESSHESGYAELRRIEAEIRGAERAKESILNNLKSLRNPDIIRELEASYEAQEREIARLQADLVLLREGKKQRQTVLEARPVLERVIAHWSEVPRESRRELFEVLAHYAKVSQLDQINRQMVVYWRDGSQSTFDFRRGARRVFWTREELEQMREMVERGAPQWEILKAFPTSSWFDIAPRYLHHFCEPGTSFWDVYKGEKKYPYRVKWHETDEYKAELAYSELEASSTVSHACQGAR